MPNPYASDRGRLKLEILELIERGAQLKEVCARPEMPGRRTVRRWADTDPWFGPALTQAYPRGAYRRMAFDPEKAAVVLSRMRAGERFRSILADPAMPSERVYRHWLTLDLSFAEAIGPIKVQKVESQRQRNRDRRQPWDPAVADRILGKVGTGHKLQELLKTDPTLPSNDTVRRWRREQPEFDDVLRFYIKAWRKHRPRRCVYTPELSERIIDLIVHGESLHSIGAMPGMPAACTLYEWVAKRPDFAAQVAHACVHREDWYLDQILQISKTATHGTIGLTKRKMGPLYRQLTRLRRRPGAKRARAG